MLHDIEPQGEAPGSSEGRRSEGEIWARAFIVVFMGEVG